MTGYLRFLFLLFLLTPLSAGAQPTQEEPVRFDWKLYQVPEEQGPSDLLVVWILPEEGWYTYAHTPGQTGQPTIAEVTLAQENRQLAVFYPPGETKPDQFDPTLLASVYEGDTPLFIPLPDRPDAPFSLLFEIRLLLCSDVSCFPVKRELSMDVENVTGLPPASQQPWWNTYLAAAQQEPEIFEEPAAAAPSPPGELELPELQPRYFLPGLEVESLGKAILLALLAGLILNVMPCVLPVITLKIRALFPAEGRGPEQKKLFRQHNIFFSCGILLFFLILASLAVFAGMAWGQLFQNEFALLALTAIVFVFGLSLLGVLNLPVIEMKSKGIRSSRSMSVEAFFTGLLATLLATPCSGPLLGGVLAWSFFQPPSIVGAVFLSIGVGMASPYIAAAVFPGAVRFIPRPGNWMGYLEQIFGFLLLATCIYLLALLPQTKIIRALLLLWFSGLAALIWGRWTTLSQSARKRWSIRAVSLILVGIGFVLALQTPRMDVATWVDFDPDSFTERLGRERMMVEFTADWCPNCKVLEKTVLNAENMSEWKERYGFVAVQVDMTRENPAMQKLLFALGSQSIPVVALFPDGEESTSPLVLRDLFTEGQLEEALEATFEEP